MHIGHSGCTATISQTQPIGMENQYAEEAAKILKRDGVNLKTVTTDGDSRIVTGIRKVYGNSVESLKDAIHYSKAHEKSIAKSKLSTAMFSGPKTERENKQKLFAKDLKRRCTAEYDSAFKKCRKIKNDGKRKSELRSILRRTPQAILKCILCKKYSHVCHGTKKKKNSAYSPNHSK